MNAQSPYPVDVSDMDGQAMIEEWSDTLPMVQCDTVDEVMNISSDAYIVATADILRDAGIDEGDDVDEFLNAIL